MIFKSYFFYSWNGGVMCSEIPLTLLPVQSVRSPVILVRGEITRAESREKWSFLWFWTVWTARASAQTADLRRM